jgi:hypothetical protein
VKWSWERLEVLKEKRSVWGWIIFILGFLWNAIGHWQNAVWLWSHIHIMGVHVNLSLLLALVGIGWLIAIVLWPRTPNVPWLQIEGQQLRIQNTDKNPIFDVLVKIGERAVLESDVIPRIEANSWTLCKKRDQPISRDMLGDIHVSDILSEGPQEIMPAEIAYKDRGGTQHKCRLEVRHSSGHLQFFLPTKTK